MIMKDKIVYLNKNDQCPKCGDTKKESVLQINTTPNKTEIIIPICRCVTCGFVACVGNDCECGDENESDETTYINCDNGCKL